MIIKKLLITGSSGYIGSCLNTYLKKRYKVYLLDLVKPKEFNKINLKNFFKCDLKNSKKLDKILQKIKPDLVIHLAAKSTVNEKIKKKNYISNNLVATRNLVNSMNRHNINKIIFSSTAAVYDKNKKRINENFKLRPISNYGKSKLQAEETIMKNNRLNYVILRFFNVSGCLKKPMIGEFHNPETHLIPISVFKSIKENDINIFGDDYKTKDGTCVRDYVHIKDICIAIEKSKNYLKKNRSTILNIGGGHGVSNKSVIKNLEKILNKNVRVNYLKKRKGDQAVLVCNITKAKNLINWRPKNSKIFNILKDEIMWSQFLIKQKINRKYSSVQK